MGDTQHMCSNLEGEKHAHLSGGARRGPQWKRDTLASAREEWDGFNYESIASGF